MIASGRYSDLAQLVLFLIIAGASVIGSVIKKWSEQRRGAAGDGAVEYDLGELLGGTRQPPTPPKPKSPPQRAERSQNRIATPLTAARPNKPKPRPAMAAGMQALNEVARVIAAGPPTTKKVAAGAGVSSAGDATVASAVHVAGAPPKTPVERNRFRAMRSSLRHAVVMAELLARPVSLRDESI